MNHARNVWDRAVTILPRVNQFWYKYTYMEEMLENLPGKPPNKYYSAVERYFEETRFTNPGLDVWVEDFQIPFLMEFILSKILI